MIYKILKLPALSREDNTFTGTFSSPTCAFSVDSSIFDEDNTMQFYKDEIKLKIKTYNIILKFLQLLTLYDLNIVTVESLTAGLIVSMLADVPTFGPRIYGGFIVYDTDAKRLMVDVTTPNVYNHTTVKEMAEGALIKTRALVAVAVSGQAGPTPPDEVSALGRVWIACSIRLNNNNFHTKTIEINSCQDDIVSKVCPEYRNAIKQESKEKRVPACLHYIGRKFVRLYTVQQAIIFAFNTIYNFFNDPKNETYVHNDPLNRLTLKPVLNDTPYDNLYLECGEPSDPIYNHLKTLPKRKPDWHKKVTPDKNCTEILKIYNDQNLISNYITAYKTYLDLVTSDILKYKKDHLLNKSKTETIEFKGGNNDNEKYYLKYLKYKNKYLQNKLK